MTRPIHRLPQAGFQNLLEKLTLNHDPGTLVDLVEHCSPAIVGPAAIQLLKTKQFVVEGCNSWQKGRKGSLTEK